jgi:hypothetical protein
LPAGFTFHRNAVNERYANSMPEVNLCKKGPKSS